MTDIKIVYKNGTVYENSCNAAYVAEYEDRYEISMEHYIGPKVKSAGTIDLGIFVNCKRTIDDSTVIVTTKLCIPKKCFNEISVKQETVFVSLDSYTTKES